MATAPATPAAEAPAGGTSFGSPGYRLYVLIVLTLVYTLNFIDRNLLAVIGPDVQAAFNLDDSTYGFLNGPPFAIFYAVMGIPIAMAADRMNRVLVVALAISVWSVMAACCGLAPSFVFLLVFRIGVAVGEAGGTPPSNSIIGDYFKPKSRANALGIFSMGVTIGGALSNYFGGPIAATLKGSVLKKFFVENHWDWAVNLLDWDKVEGWRVAFFVTGAPGVLFAILMLLTVKEPPRGFSDPPGTSRITKASMSDTFKELAPKWTFWTCAMAASLTALVGYGLTGFQAQLGGRLHGISPGDFAWNFGGPLSLAAAAGTFIGGFTIDRLSTRVPTAVSWVPAIGLLLAIPLYIWAWNMPTAEVWATNGAVCSNAQLTVAQCQAAIADTRHAVFDGLRSMPAGLAVTDYIAAARPAVPPPAVISQGGTAQIALWVWMLGAMFHYSYLGSQYTISQGVVSQRGRASAVAILLLLVALIGNGIGPFLVGFLSDTQMQNHLNADPNGAGLHASDCRLLLTGKAGMTDGYMDAIRRVTWDQFTQICTPKYGAGLKDAMTYVALIFIPASLFFMWSSFTLKKDMIAKTY